jgi:predicted thioredoxin/glutaredoxin
MRQAIIIRKYVVLMLTIMTSIAAVALVMLSRVVNAVLSIAWGPV